MRPPLFYSMLFALAAMTACADDVDNRRYGDGSFPAGDQYVVTGDSLAGDTAMGGDPSGDFDQAGDHHQGDDHMGDDSMESDDDLMGDLDSGGDADAGPTTTIRIHYDTGLGNTMTVRGQGVGLSWDTGATTTWTSGNVWVFTTNAWDAPVQVKPVYVSSGGEEAWAPGPNWIARPGQTLDIHPFFFATGGRVTELTVATRPVAIYLPPSYDEWGARERQYPVLFMHDGQNLFDPLAMMGGWHVDETMDQLLTYGSTETSDGWTDLGGVREIIIVAPHNTSQRIYEYTPSNASFDDCDADSQACGGGADDYLDFLQTQVRPAVDTAYRTTGSTAGIAGSSLGGLLSLHACWTRPATFDRCGVFSPSLWWDNELLLMEIEAWSGSHTGVAWYLGAGTLSDGLAETTRLATALNDPWTPQLDLMCLAGVGMNHNEPAWRYRSPWALHFLYQDPDRVQAQPTLPSDLYSCVN